MPPLNLRSRLIPLPMMLLALFALQGCFHNDDDPAPAPPPPVVNADPVGYYTNTGFVDVKTGDNSTQRLVSGVQGMVHDGQLLMLSESENMTYVGVFTVSGNDISGSVTLYEADVMRQENVPLSGMITQGSKITGTLSGTGAANGTFQLDYAADNGPVDMSMVVRLLSWEPVTGNPPDLPFVSVGDDTAPIPNFISAISGGGVFNNCDYDARIEPVAGTHLYSVSGTVSACTNPDLFANPNYTGLVSVRSDVNANDRMIVVLTNGAYDFSGEYRAR
ncbi:hypothetical protein MNBD_GAMMA17-662 [hydrothermal vent metagenome]|uniref:Lipoprotein n=1 Tax=hydrothermal vent metagenome TaxID=652676 RepID=A0A3B0Z8T2_9ZZZZ